MSISQDHLRQEPQLTELDLNRIIVLKALWPEWMLWSSIQRAVGSLLRGIQARDQRSWRGVGWENLLASLLSRLWRIAPPTFRAPFTFAPSPLSENLEQGGHEEEWADLDKQAPHSKHPYEHNYTPGCNEGSTEKPWLTGS